MRSMLGMIGALALATGIGLFASNAKADDWREGPPPVVYEAPRTTYVVPVDSPYGRDDYRPFEGRREWRERWEHERHERHERWEREGRRGWDHDRDREWRR